MRHLRHCPFWRHLLWPSRRCRRSKPRCNARAKQSRIARRCFRCRLSGVEIVGRATIRVGVRCVLARTFFADPKATPGWRNPPLTAAGQSVGLKLDHAAFSLIFGPQNARAGTMYMAQTPCLVIVTGAASTAPNDQDANSPAKMSDRVAPEINNQLPKT